MPKKKVDSQQGVRLELQESERDMLRFYSTSAAIKNVGVGVGAVALPLCIVAAGVAIAAIFEKGYDGIAGDLRRITEERDARTEEEWANAYQEYVVEFQRRKDNPITAGEAGEAASQYGAASPGLPWKQIGWLGDLFGTTSQSSYVFGVREEPMPYEEWRAINESKGIKDLVSGIAGGWGSLVTFGL